MFAYRQRGLVTLHSVVVCGFVTLLLPTYALLIPYLPRIRLNPGVTLFPYIIVVFFAMTISASAIRKVSGTLHTISTAGAFALAARQITYVAAAIFTVVFALKDQEVSRLFLGTYLLLGFVFLSYLHAKLPSGLAKLLFPERNKLPTILVGRGDSLEDLDAWISSRGHIGIHPVGFLSEQQPSRGEKAIAPYLGTIDQLETVLRERAISQVIMLDWHESNEVIEHVVCGSGF